MKNPPKIPTPPPVRIEGKDESWKADLWILLLVVGIILVIIVGLTL